MANINDILNQDSEAKTKSYKKGDFIQREGENCTQGYYVKKGLLRSYTIDHKGKEHIFMFATEGWIIGDIESQEFNQPAKLFIDCIEDSEIIIFDRNRINKMDFSIDQLNKNNTLLLRRMAVLQRRVLMLMSATAQERYEFFLDTYPELPNRLSQRMIASYLGITPEALSKIRGIMAKSK
jgi:CRP-like cAMP-binding protein